MRIRTVICLSCILLLTGACRSSGESASEGAKNASSAVRSSQSTEANVSAATLNVVAATPATVSSAELPASGSAQAAQQSATDADSVTFPATSTPVSVAGSVASAPETTQQDEAAQSSITGIMPERIHIPSINLDTPIVELSWHPAQADDGRIFSEWDVADQAAGWHKNSSLLGQDGNVVLSGHNNILGAVFRELDQLKRGDEALLWVEDSVHRYLIDKVMIVPEKYATLEQREANAAWIGHFEDDRLTLVSCWPRDDNSHRIIVVAYADDSQASISLSITHKSKE